MKKKLSLRFGKMTFNQRGNIACVIDQSFRKRRYRKFLNLRKIIQFISMTERAQCTAVIVNL